MYTYNKAYLRLKKTISCYENNLLCYTIVIYEVYNVNKYYIENSKEMGKMHVR